jgi:ABC-type transport system involved in Fe-S cluster assembly fused permease/ATPase subunit
MSNQNNLLMQYNAPLNFISFFSQEMNYEESQISKELFWQIEWKKSFK